MIINKNSKDKMRIRSNSVYENKTTQSPRSNGVYKNGIIQPQRFNDCPDCDLQASNRKLNRSQIVGWPFERGRNYNPDLGDILTYEQAGIAYSIITDDYNKILVKGTASNYSFSPLFSEHFQATGSSNTLLTILCNLVFASTGKKVFPELIEDIDDGIIANNGILYRNNSIGGGETLFGNIWIKLQGSRECDYAEADNIAKLIGLFDGKRPKHYVWHHVYMGWFNTRLLELARDTCYGNLLFINGQNTEQILNTFNFLSGEQEASFNLIPFKKLLMPHTLYIRFAEFLQSDLDSARELLDYFFRYVIENLDSIVDILLSDKEFCIQIVNLINERDIQINIEDANDDDDDDDENENNEKIARNLWETNQDLFKSIVIDNLLFDVVMGQLLQLNTELFEQLVESFTNVYNGLWHFVSTKIGIPDFLLKSEIDGNNFYDASEWKKRIDWWNPVNDFCLIQLVHKSIHEFCVAHSGSVTQHKDFCNVVTGKRSYCKK